MKRRFSEEQIIGILKEHEAGVSAKELCRRHGMSDASFYKWKAKFGGMEVSEARRLRDLEAEEASCGPFTGQDGSGGRSKKDLSPEARRKVVELLKAFGLSERRACCLAHPLIKRALFRATAALLNNERCRDVQSTTTGSGNLTAALVAHARELALSGQPQDFELMRDWEEVASTEWHLYARSRSCGRNTVPSG